MSFWLIGLLLIVAYLVIQNVSAHIRHKNLVATLSIISNLLGTVGQLPKDDVEEYQEAWTQATEASSFSTMGATLISILIFIFLAALGFRGHF